MAAFAALAAPHLTPSYKNLLLWGSGGTAVFCVYVFFAAFTKKERTQLVRATIGLVPKKQRTAR